MARAAAGRVMAAALLPAGRLRWARELTLVAALYGGYMLARALIGVHVEQAEARGADILGLEAVLALDLERPLNAFLTAVPALGLLAAYLYATLHYLVTPAVLAWVALRRRGAYAAERNALLIATALGLVGYWLLPTAPPRLVDTGLTDTMAAFSDLGWWGSAASAPRGMESLSNQYAAMPSLHVGWAVWVAACLTVHAGSRLVRRWAWTYPALMALVVMATANHYLLDVVAGAACAYAGVRLARRTPARTRADHVPTAGDDMDAARHAAGGRAIPAGGGCVPADARGSVDVPLRSRRPPTAPAVLLRSARSARPSFTATVRDERTASAARQGDRERRP